MSNPTTLPAIGTAYTANLFQSARQGPPATIAPQSPSDSAATNFQVALGKAASDNLRDVNDFGVSAPTSARLSCASATNTPRMSASIAGTSTIETSGQNEMPKNRQALTEAGSTAVASTPANSGVTKDGSATAMSHQPTLRSTLMQTQLSKDESGHADTSRSAEQVELHPEPVQSVVQPCSTPSQLAQADSHAATASRPLAADQITSGAAPSDISSNPEGPKIARGHTGQSRSRVSRSDDTGSTASDQIAPKPDPSITILPNTYAPITTSVSTSSTDASVQLPNSSQTKLVGGQPGTSQPLEDMFASVVEDSGSAAHIPAAENLIAASSSPFWPATSNFPAREGSSAAKSVAVGMSASGNAIRTASRHTGNDASAYLVSSMASAPPDQVNLGAASPTASSIQADPLLALAQGSTLTGKPVEATVTDDSCQMAAPQVSPALISLAARTDGSNEITVSLNPKDLGEVQVHLVRGHDGTTIVSITASNPETLQELAQNVHHLHAALDMANVPSDGRTMNFITASAAASAQGQSDLADRSPSTSQDGASESGGQNPGQGRTWQQNQQGGSAGNTADDSSSYDPRMSVASRKTWQLRGLNITA